MENKKEKIEQKIEEIIEFIDTCKFKSFSNNIILVNKDEMDSYLLDLKKCAPDEIKRYQKIIANREAIIAEAEKIRNDAKQEAQEIINKAINQTNELISEHEIMQRAYDQANNIIEMAANQAQEMMDNAAAESNNMKDAATQYTDNLLAHIENLASTYINSSAGYFDSLINGLNECIDTVRVNREELYPAVTPTAAPVVNTEFIQAQAKTPGGTTELPDLELL